MHRSQNLIFELGIHFNECHFCCNWLILNHHLNHPFMIIKGNRFLTFHHLTNCDYLIMTTV